MGGCSGTPRDTLPLSWDVFHEEQYCTPGLATWRSPGQISSFLCGGCSARHVGLCGHVYGKEPCTSASVDEFV